MHATAAPRHRRLVGAALASLTAMVGLATLAAPAAHGAASVDHTESSQDVVSFAHPVAECVNGGDGETLLLSGTLHSFGSTTFDAAGGFHLNLHTNLAGMSALGTTTGTRYRVTDTADEFGGRISVYGAPGDPFPRSVTQSGDVRIISAGSGDNVVVRATWHLTINANGDVTVADLHFETRCVG